MSVHSAVERLDREQVMERIPVASSMIQSVGYDHTSSILEIEFRSGKVYRYLDVPQQTHIELMSAGSKGGYFEAYIKNAGYSYERSL